jgi:receptor protein-tyrosine kinase
MSRLSDALDRAKDFHASDDPPEHPPFGWKFGAPEIVAKAPHPVAEPARAIAEPGDAVEAARRLEERFSEDNRLKVVVGPDAKKAVVEQYRRLAAVLHHAQRERRARSVMIASAVPAEGKTLTATNIALTLSQSYQRRVLLVDADLRQPGIHTMFDLPNRVGLVDALTEPTGRRLPVKAASPTLWILTAGHPSQDPMGVLVSDAMRDLLSQAMETFDWVVIDTPPVAILSDANLLAGMIDTALLVVGARSTPYPMAQRAVEAIGPSKILGVVLNRAERPELSDGYGHYASLDRSQVTQPSRGRRWLQRWAD